MKLAQLMKSVCVEADGKQQRQKKATYGSLVPDLDISSVHYRAQDVTPGGLFVAVKGFCADGHDFVQEAVKRGAIAVVCERRVKIDVCQLLVDDSRKALAHISAAYYQHPSIELKLIGITGTNGKTTVSYLIESILQSAGINCGVIGTINYRYGGQIFENSVTTPESLDLQRILADMHAAGVTHVVMEVSSHALDLHRVQGCVFDIGVFTNLTQDHLDYHKDMASYWNCKKLLFTDFLPDACKLKRPKAVINGNDPKGMELGAQIKIPFLYTGLNTPDCVRAEEARFDLNGITCSIATASANIQIRSQLTGKHNLENILNAVGAGACLDLPLEYIRTGIEALANVPGRLERITNSGRRFVYVDYAHTPDALENVLSALRALTRDRIFCVFGCGGDRDKNKRSQMGAIAARLSDLTVVTSDNPRTEQPGQIINGILEGVRNSENKVYTGSELLRNGFNGKGYAVEIDRRKAIRLSVNTSRPGDTILIAGKGHEPYQIIGRKKYPFDDRFEAEQALSELK
ncbi:MAG: UDP-N-acetylmuramoyl-L-alanyl-D-glutamate--2,6-diaminopimelate ligase [Desulfobacteraceae bacterium]|nr:UDP-N-acetylmuramoyl-L-alanyl-D-glutamate--2,6-diaminopimelate ligase [Desulfobacteraceae bacterium]